MSVHLSLPRFVVLAALGTAIACPAKKEPVDEDMMTVQSQPENEVSMELSIETECEALAVGEPCPIVLRAVNRSSRGREVHSAGFEVGADLQVFAHWGEGEPLELGPILGIEVSADAGGVVSLGPGESIETRYDIAANLMGLMLHPGQVLEIRARYWPDRTLSRARGQQPSSDPAAAVNAAPIRLVVGAVE